MLLLVCLLPSLFALCYSQDSPDAPGAQDPPGGDPPPPLNCDPGQYGTSSCTNCPAGTHRSTAGAQSLGDCLACAAGTWSSAGAAGCTTCGAGTWSSASAAACTACGTGSYQPNTGATSSSACLPCGAGRYQPTTSATSSSACLLCAKGTSSSLSTAASCSNCATGYWSAPGASSCFTGCVNATADFCNLPLTITASGSSNAQTSNQFKIYVAGKDIGYCRHEFPTGIATPGLQYTSTSIFFCTSDLSECSYNACAVVKKWGTDGVNLNNIGTMDIFMGDQVSGLLTETQEDYLDEVCAANTASSHQDVGIDCSSATCKSVLVSTCSGREWSAELFDPA